MNIYIENIEGNSLNGRLTRDKGSVNLNVEEEL